MAFPKRYGQRSLFSIVIPTTTYEGLEAEAKRRGVGWRWLAQVAVKIFVELHCSQPSLSQNGPKTDKQTKVPKDTGITCGRSIP